MNLWECCEPGCKVSARGVGGAIGLRAIGWHSTLGGQLRCPAHYPETAPCTRGDKETAGQACAQCAANLAADAAQALLTTPEDQETGKRLDARPLSVAMAEIGHELGHELGTFDSHRAWADVGQPPQSLEVASCVDGGALDSTLAGAVAATDMLLAGLRVAAVRDRGGARGVVLEIAGALILRESHLASLDTSFPRPIFVSAGTPIVLDVLDGRVELLGLRVAPSTRAAAIAAAGMVFGKP